MKFHVEITAQAQRDIEDIYEWIKRDPDFESIRNEPGYLELMKGK